MKTLDPAIKMKKNSVKLNSLLLATFRHMSNKKHSLTILEKTIRAADRLLGAWIEC